MSETPHAALLRAVTNVLDVFSEARGEVATSFNCGEAEIIADLYRVTGDHEGANEFLLEHAADDDEGDDHHLCSECSEDWAEGSDGMCDSCLHDAQRSGWESGENSQ